MQEILEKKRQVKKLNKNNYLVIINNKEYKLHIETIVKYNLLSSEINYSCDEIINLDQTMRKNLDIEKYFIKFPKSKKEAIYLLVHKYNLTDYNDILNRLIRLNIINDNILRDNIINNLEYRGYGPLYINNYLYKRGLENNYSKVYDINELVVIFNKLLKNKDYTKDKVYRYLLTKGYNINDINLYFSHIK